MPSVARIDIFPIKALDPLALNESELTPRGPLAFDRAWRLVDAKGQPINGKRRPDIHALRASFDWAGSFVKLTHAGESQSFHLLRQRADLEAWCSRVFGGPVRLEHEPDACFPDDMAAPGPTIISTATLETVASWFPGMTLENARRRFRTNVEIDGVPPFWEDRLFGERDERIVFKIGAVEFEGVNPCQRCVVPTRDPWTGEVTADFQKIFSARRKETLPRWAELSRFNHFFRLAINTMVRPSQAGKRVRVGDEVVL